MIQISQNDLVFVGTAKLLVWENNGVKDDHLAGHNHVATEDCDGGVKLAAAIEQRIVLHLGKRLVGVRILWRALYPGPVSHSGVPADDCVDDQGVFPHC